MNPFILRYCYIYNCLPDDEDIGNFMKKHYSKVLAYKDFIPMFIGDQFDAEKWAELFLESGARFVYFFKFFSNVWW